MTLKQLEINYNWYDTQNIWYIRFNIIMKQNGQPRTNLTHNTKES